MADLHATNRLQLSPEFGFEAARELVPYLRELGVSHLYLSPTLQARSGSTHGYDVVDPTTVSEALGGEAQLRALAAEMPLILDIVPNHMGRGDENPWWADPIERHRVFDVDEETDFVRRFFDIDDLVAVKQEQRDVFELTHRKTLELVRDGIVDGLRVDHPDGLADPAGYLEQLRRAGAPRIWVEKILHPGEPLRSWHVDGTVGYEFLNDAQALFVDNRSEELFTDVWTELSGDGRPFETLALEAQIEQATTTFHREVAWLQRLAPQFDTAMLAEALALLPVYRTYVRPQTREVDAWDRHYLAVAGLDKSLTRILSLDERGYDEFVTRFQQFTPPVTAKGIEDTAFYRYHRMIALNEVGGDPGRFGMGVEAFHEANAQRHHRFPNNLLISTTHDTKRSADVRARIGALTTPQLRDDWAVLARRWAPQAPDAGTGVFVLQTLLGVHPIEPLERLDGYLEKALREAKQRTNWVDQDHDYENEVKSWARGLLRDETFLREFEPLCARVAWVGAEGALGQLLLKLTAPGIPDIYSGDELEFRALVDPDNRRPVDWDARRSALAEPPPKLALIKSVLELRARRPDAFAGGYEPVDAPEGCCAYLRGGDVLVVVPFRGNVRGTVAVPGFDEVPAARLALYERQ
jgi:(1->4)-alpha-D-glucan 1-alpha-D-glucosylmutase